MTMYKIVPVLFLFLGACGGEDPQNAAQIVNIAEGNASADPVRNADAPAANVQAAAPQPKSIRVGAIQIPYDAASLTPLPARIAVPPDWKTEVDGIKFLGRDRAGLMDRAECMYGLSDKASRCNVQQEAGLSFAAIAIPFARLSAKLPAGQRKPIALAGTNGVTWQIGVEGEGAEYILLPMGKGTILIVRQFRTSGNPDDGALGTLLGDLKLDDTP